MKRLVAVFFLGAPLTGAFGQGLINFANNSSTLRYIGLPPPHCHDAPRQALHDLHGAERSRVRPEDLLKRFDDVRRREQLDATVAEMLQRSYI